MENKMSKPYLAVSILLIVLSPFVLFYFGLIPGIIYLVLGILSLIFAKKQKKLVIVILAIVGIVLFLLTIALNSLVTFVSQVIYFIDGGSLDSPSLYDFYNGLNIFLGSITDPHHYPYVDVPTYIFRLIFDYNALITPVYAALTLPLILLAGTSLFKGKVGNIIVRIITCVLALISVASLLMNVFITLYGSLRFNYDHGILTIIINYIINGIEFKYIIESILRVLITDHLKIYTLVTLALPVFTFVCALIGPYGRCKKHE